MKRVFLLRHAKSSWDDPALSDFERPLNRRGRAAAPLVGRYLADHGLIPSLILCSAARRTRETLALLLSDLAGETVIRIEQGLYEAGAGQLLARIRQVPPEVPSVLLIGHNPGLEELASDLIADGPAEDVARLAGKFPTAALAAIHFDARTWNDVVARSGTLERFVVPSRSDRGD